MICTVKEIIPKEEGNAVIITDYYDIGFWATPGLWEDMVVGMKIDIEVPDCTYPYPTIKRRNKRRFLMYAYQERVIKEKEELDLKIKRLGAFITSENNKELSDMSQYLLRSQYDLMRQYSNCLEQRIKMFNS